MQYFAWVETYSIVHACLENIVPKDVLKKTLFNMLKKLPL